MLKEKEERMTNNTTYMFLCFDLKIKLNWQAIRVNS